MVKEFAPNVVKSDTLEAGRFLMTGICLFPPLYRYSLRLTRCIVILEDPPVQYVPDEHHRHLVHEAKIIQLWAKACSSRHEHGKGLRI
jgi:hypothetical protein